MENTDVCAQVSLAAAPRLVRLDVSQNNFGGAFYEVGDFEPGLVRVDVREDHSGCDIVCTERRTP